MKNNHQLADCNYASYIMLIVGNLINVKIHSYTAGLVFSFHASLCNIVYGEDVEFFFFLFKRLFNHFCFAFDF